MKIDALGSALEGLTRAKDRLVGAANNIAEDGGTVDDIIETRLATREAEANIKVIKVVDDLERKLLDEIA